MTWQAAAQLEMLTESPRGERLTCGEKAVLLTIARYYSEETRRAWISTKRLADITCLTRKGAYIAVQSLSAKGLVTIEKRYKENGAQEINRYGLPTYDPDRENLVRRGSEPSTQGGAYSVRRVTNKEQNQSKTQKEAEIASAPDAPQRNRKPDPVWDTLAEIFGDVRNDLERGRRNKAVQHFRSAGLPDTDLVTLIRRAHGAWSNVMGTATETPFALAGNLSLLLDGPQRNGRANGHTYQGKAPTPRAESTPVPEPPPAALTDEEKARIGASVRESGFWDKQLSRKRGPLSAAEWGAVQYAYSVPEIEAMGRSVPAELLGESAPPIASADS